MAYRHCSQGDFMDEQVTKVTTGTFSTVKTGDSVEISEEGTIEIH